MTGQPRALRSLPWLVAIVAAAIMMMPLPSARAAPLDEAARPGTLTTQQWRPWRDRFVTLDGRVVDNANKNISHSEGQGYGLLLAVLAGDREAFTRIWTFTHNELLLRDDGLAAWRWDPNSNPHVTDINDASDGDILIAYSLALAGNIWNMPSWTETSHAMAITIGQKLVRRVGDRTILLPGVEGFDVQDREDGPVVNLSYWIFEAIPVLAHFAPSADWDALSADGRSLIREARFGPAKLPSNWISLHGSTPAMAKGFDPWFGYDAIRIPLYLLRAGITDRTLLEPFAQSWDQADATPAVIDLEDGKAVETLGDPGYRMIAAALQCALNRKPIPSQLRQQTSDLYYPSTLYLLAISAVAQRFPECL